MILFKNNKYILLYILLLHIYFVHTHTHTTICAMCSLNKPTLQIVLLIKNVKNMLRSADICADIAVHYSIKVDHSNWLQKTNKEKKKPKLNNLTNDVFWHLHTMHSCLLSLFHFYCQLYTVYPALLIVSFPFPSFCSTRLLSSYHHTSHTGFRAWRVAVNLTPPGLFFIAWRLIHF